MTQEDAHWALNELPEHLATMTCSHILEQGAEPTFVDYNAGDLTIFCEIGEAHEDEDEYRMVGLYHFLKTFPSLGSVRLVGGNSRAERRPDGTWEMQIRPFCETEAANDN